VSVTGAGKSPATRGGTPYPSDRNGSSSSNPRVCRDLDGGQVLAIAIIGSVDVLVTGATDLLALGMHGGVTIMSVAEFAPTASDQ